jgi:hypothetical protein
MCVCVESLCFGVLGVVGAVMVLQNYGSTVVVEWWLAS